MMGFIPPSRTVRTYPQLRRGVVRVWLTFAAGAMTVLDTEPLDGVDYRNGVVGYITLVCILDFVFAFAFKG